MTPRIYKSIPLSLLLLWAALTCCGQSAPRAIATIDSGVPLRVALDHRLEISRAGEAVTAHLTAPVYVADRLALPVGTPVLGSVTEIEPATRKQHLGRVMHGDFTPPREAAIQFQKLLLPDGRTLTIQTAVAERSGQLVHMQEAAHKSLTRRAKDLARQHKDDALHTVKEDMNWEHLKEQLLLSLPYHPQWIDAGTAFDAALTAPVEVPVSAARVTAERAGPRLPPNSMLYARLLSPVSSATDKKGSAVSAMLTEPLLDTQHHLLLPEGTILHGEVTRATPARRLARNGQLRFIFNSLDVPGMRAERLHGQITATEGDPKANLQVDSEGAAQARSAKNKYLAPLTLALLAASAQADDEGGAGQGFFAGGFGLIGRVVVLAARSNPVSAGFSYYSMSQSVYSRLIARGHDVTFPKNTRMEIQVGER